MHPADPASSAGRLAAAVAMRLPAARHSSKALGKRKHYELDGQYGAYSQASAQAAGMSMTDHMQQAMHRSSGASGSRLPPYPETSISYPRRGGPSSSSVLMPAAAAHSQPYEQYPNPVSPEYRHQQHSMGSPGYGQSGMGSPTYRASMPTSPQYSPHADARYGRQASMQEREAAEDASALECLRPPTGYASGPPYWNPQPLTDGETQKCINCSTVLKSHQASSSWHNICRTCRLCIGQICDWCILHIGACHVTGSFCSECFACCRPGIVRVSALLHSLKSAKPLVWVCRRGTTGSVCFR